MITRMTFTSSLLSHPWQDSNPRERLRRPSSCPLNDRGLLVHESVARTLVKVFQCLDRIIIFDVVGIPAENITKKLHETELGIRLPDDEHPGHEFPFHVIVYGTGTFLVPAVAHESSSVGQEGLEPSCTVYP